MTNIKITQQNKLDKKYRYSEIFGNTIQGEGKKTGVSTIWYRALGCNFNCDGFGQKNPLDKSSWILPYKDIDVSKYKSVEELPVFEQGCDSSYSWSKKFACLAKHETVSEIVDKLENLLPHKKFLNPTTNQWQHMAFTGGEPMMSQSAIVDIMDEFHNRDNTPKFVTIETNGTQKPRQNFIDCIERYFSINEPIERYKEYPELFWSVSPKLFLSGEDWDKAIKPDVLQEYNKISQAGQLKYVCDGSDRAWDEIEKATKLYRDVGVNWDVWIMPVGATREEQEEIQARVAEEAISRGYYVSTRVHCWLFGNLVGK